MPSPWTAEQIAELRRRFPMVRQDSAAILLLEALDEIQGLETVVGDARAYLAKYPEPEKGGPVVKAESGVTIEDVEYGFEHGPEDMEDQ